MTDLLYPPGCEEICHNPVKECIMLNYSLDDIEDVKARNARNDVLYKKKIGSISIQKTNEGWSKTKHYSKRNKISTFHLETSNRFETLKTKNHSDIEDDGNEIEDTNKNELRAKLSTGTIKAVKVKSSKGEESKPIHQPCKIIDTVVKKDKFERLYFQQFETKNRYSLLCDNAEEDIEKILKRYQLTSTPRHSLK